MRLVVVYRPKSEHARIVETFIADFNRLHAGIGRRIEVLSTDTRDGMSMMNLYDLMAHPAIVVLSDDGRAVASWLGPQLPLMDEVASYFYTTQS